MTDNAIQLNGIEVQKQSNPMQPDLVCFSHLRWNYVYQRPQHLMTRFARQQRVFYVEEPKVESGPSSLNVRTDDSGVVVAIPYLDVSSGKEQQRKDHIRLIQQLFEEYGIYTPILWYYTPMAVDYTRDLPFSLVVYDCMDELSAFNGAPPKMTKLEEELFQRANLVFTGGRSLYDIKKNQHPNVHLFPSSIDREHFAKAREIREDPQDQAGIPHPRIGFFGVIDERMDLELLNALCGARPEWHFVMIGPLAKVEPEQLPAYPNIHFLGMKDYAELPGYLAGWDAAILPFARNNATRFISPTKTPEYLAGGKPVISTPIRDVVQPYGEKGLVWIAETAVQFINAIEKSFELNGKMDNWLRLVDGFLADNSWDTTMARMGALMKASLSSGKEESEESGIRLQGNGYSAEQLSLPPASSNLRKQNHSQGVMFDYLVVGAGFAGSVLAERLARGSGKKVLLIDRRSHVGGNAYDYYNGDGILIHKYGPHIFHTNSKEVFSYLSQFTEWRPYEHRVRASVDGQLLPIPINLDTINQMYGMQLTSRELEDFFQSVAESVEKVETSEDVVVSRIGRELYEKFFRNYTRKQWDLDPSELDASVTSRVPIRFNRDDRYFTDTYQAMPLYGYTRMFENLLDHPNIKIMLNTDFREVIDFISYRDLVYTGPVDEYFNYLYGRLPYRSLQFRFETLDEHLHQPVAVINYPNEHPYTRVTEFKHLTGQEHAKTTLVYEYPCSSGDPYYPIPRKENADLYRKYKALANQQAGVHFAGRLATYRYYNMDQVTAQALTIYARTTGQSKEDAVSAYTSSHFSIVMPCPVNLGQHPGEEAADG